MSELAEGARLEIVCTAKSGTEGSNPSLSAMSIPLQAGRNPQRPSDFIPVESSKRGVSPRSRGLGITQE
jgi:hypothetical protein